jgi:hypothetical protein
MTDKNEKWVLKSVYATNIRSKKVYFVKNTNFVPNQILYNDEIYPLITYFS